MKNKILFHICEYIYIYNFLVTLLPLAPHEFIKCPGFRPGKSGRLRELASLFVSRIWSVSQSGRGISWNRCGEVAYFDHREFRGAVFDNASQTLSPSVSRICSGRVLLVLWPLRLVVPGAIRRMRVSTREIYSMYIHAVETGRDRTVLDTIGTFGW